MITVRRRRWPPTRPGGSGFGRSTIRTPGTGTSCRRWTKYSWNATSCSIVPPSGAGRAPSRGCAVRRRSRAQRDLDAPPACDLGWPRGEGHPGTPGRPVEIVPRSRSPRPNQRSPPRRPSVSIACHDSPKRPQPALRVDLTGERVGDGVEVRADAEAVELQVVAHVDDRGDLTRRVDALDARKEPGGTDASGEHADHRADATGRAPDGEDEPDRSSPERYPPMTYGSSADGMVTWLKAKSSQR